MNLEQIKLLEPQIMAIAKKHGINKISVFGSVARDQATIRSDVDFIVELESGASLFGVAGFAYEVEKLLGIQVDVIPISLLPKVKDRNFVEKIQQEAVAL